MSEAVIDFVLPDAAATDALGAALARACRAVRTTGPAAVLYFKGELGAGKTACVRSLLRTLGVEGLIRSPTYTLVETYAAGGLSCVHVDLYRLAAPLEAEELGLRDLLDDANLLLVEWPEKGGAVVPEADLEIDLAYHESHRLAHLRGRSTAGRHWVQMLALDSSLNSYVPNLT